MICELECLKCGTHIHTDDKNTGCSCGSNDTSLLFSKGWEGDIEAGQDVTYIKER